MNDLTSTRGTNREADEADKKLRALVRKFNRDMERDLRKDREEQRIVVVPNRWNVGPSR